MITSFIACFENGDRRTVEQIDISHPNNPITAPIAAAQWTAESIAKASGRTLLYVKERKRQCLTVL